ncbi:CYTH and CHAD domain-containing protein [Lapillicoccus sp.]|uniref:CYTH and CHAD domain-containing protein n=1 Tax=Lapillicoccus sp. TaxID=1909287 RepID=UPI0032658751
MAVSRMSEREVTFDVDDGWEVPALGEVVPDGGRVETATHELVATYVDTETSTLRLLGLTLRHRQGGSDAGWHLKVPAGSARTEIHTDAASDVVPQALSQRLDGLVMGAALRPVATIRTTRRVTRVLTSRGRLVFEVADDLVTGSRLDESGEEGPTIAWREIEVELGPGGSEAELSQVVVLFGDAGARPAAVQRKIDHVLGEPRMRQRSGIPGVLADYVAAQCGAILTGDVLLRDDPTSDAVHQTRVAIRRLRSSLRSLHRLVDLDPEALSRADEDLRWLGQMLSPIRDGDILGQHVNAELDALPRSDVVGPVREEVRRFLTTDRREAVERWRESWRDDHYRRVMAMCRLWYVSPPVREDVSHQAGKALRKARRRLERRLDAALAVSPPDPHGLHQARKAAKRLRYLGDLLGERSDELSDDHPGEWVKGARRESKRAKRLQEVLGEHQDLVVLSDFLRRMARGPVHNGFTYGLLAGRVDERMARVRSRISSDL